MTSILPRPDVETSIWIACPPEKLWEFLYDVSNDTQWREGVNAGQWISDPPHGVGLSGLHIVEGIGDWPWTVTEWEEPRFMSWNVTGGRFQGARAGYRVAPEDAGSVVTIHMRVKPSAVTRVLILTSVAGAPPGSRLCPRQAR